MLGSIPSRNLFDGILKKEIAGRAIEGRDKKKKREGEETERKGEVITQIYGDMHKTYTYIYANTYIIRTCSMYNMPSSM